VANLKIFVAFCLIIFLGLWKKVEVRVSTLAMATFYVFFYNVFRQVSARVQPLMCVWHLGFSFPKILQICLVPSLSTVISVHQ